MSSPDLHRRSPDLAAAALPEDARATFITRTYVHLYGAIVGFTLLEAFLFMSGLALPLARAFLSVSWLWVLGGFVLVSWLFSRIAHNAESMAVQYAALAAYVVAEGLIFVPMLLVAQFFAPGTIQAAATITLLAFTALTVIVHVTRRNISLLCTLLAFGVLAAVGTHSSR